MLKKFKHPAGKNSLEKDTVQYSKINEEKENKEA